MHQADTIKKFNEEWLECSVVDPIDAEHNVEEFIGIGQKECRIQVWNSENSSVEFKCGILSSEE